MRIHALDSIEAHAQAAKEAQLTRLIAAAPDSYFAHVVSASRAVDGAQRKSPMDVAHVFDFSDPTLLRSSAYPQAVMTFLRNLNAVSEEQFVNASDTLLRLASGDPECRNYMVGQLLELFATYGPDMALQHLVDIYVKDAPPGLDLSAATLAKIKDLEQVTTGSIGPDIVLPVPDGDTTRLSLVMAGHPYTLLFFYSSTCSHCQAQMPGVVELYGKLKAKGALVVGVGSTSPLTIFIVPSRSTILIGPASRNCRAGAAPQRRRMPCRPCPLSSCWIPIAGSWPSRMTRPRPRRS